MKLGWWGLLLLVVGLGMPVAARAQVSAYGEFSGTYLTNLTNSTTLYGATTGVLIDGPSLHKVLLTADIQGRFVGKSGESLVGVTVGPRFSFKMSRFAISPFAEFMVGFARFHNQLPNQPNISSSDSTIQVNGGVAKRVSPRWDAVLDYSYSQFYYNDGEYNPKTFSIGAVYHFVKR